MWTHVEVMELDMVPRDASYYSQHYESDNTMEGEQEPLMDQLLNDFNINVSLYNFSTLSGRS